MIKPNYENNSIVNLMSTILTHMGGHSPYKELEHFPSEDLADARTVILLVIDGMGYNFLSKYFPDSFLFQNVKTKMTSIFPSTTAAAMTTFYTGLAPQDHGIPSWFTYLRELGLISTILPFQNRATRNSLQTKTVSAQNILKIESLFKECDGNQFIFLPKEIIGNPYGNVVLNQATQCGYKYGNVKSFFKTMIKVLKKSNKSKSSNFLLGYWPNFDSSCHGKGVAHPETLNHFTLLLDQLEKFIQSIKQISPQTKILITADHGLIDTPPERMLFLEDHPELSKCLTLPLSGEPRAPFFYVRPAKVPQFEAYIQKNLSFAGDLKKGEDLIAENYFGLFPSHPKFEERIGDYVFLMRENYILNDRLEGEERSLHIGNHGGLSEDEMFVPLIIF
ncbi:alkaline phosphatase family protein [Candidatus Lokiarchaeum ossiferum]|uniref:alkaline phosphatase family protein n=1 Tax=Candidatus Lokiarchaeum ossiferum TaxID=2951803 RepID=UPI00352EDED1